MPPLRRLTAELGRWPAIRWAAALAAASLSAVLLVFASALPLARADAASLWSLAAVAAGSALIGLVVASFLRTPIGADATLCDLRWPSLGLLALHLSTDLRSAEPLLSEAARPAVAVAAICLLIWALRERLARERRATGLAVAGAEASGEACTTCRPLFPRTGAPGANDHTVALPPAASGSVGGKA